MGELFLAVTADLGQSDDLPRVREVVRRAHAAGVRVSALGGDAGWVDEPEAAQAWLRAAVDVGLFDGVHLDIEVWTHPEWDSRRGDVVSAYLHLLTTLRAGCPVRFEVDLAHWLHEVTTQERRPLDTAVIGIADAVTVLSFRNTVTGPDSISTVAAPTLAHAKAHGRACRLAVETNDLGADPVIRKQTFHHLGRAKLLRAWRGRRGFRRRLGLPGDRCAGP